VREQGGGIRDKITWEVGLADINSRTKWNTTYHISRRIAVTVAVVVAVVVAVAVAVAAVAVPLARSLARWKNTYPVCPTVSRIPRPAVLLSASSAGPTHSSHSSHSSHPSHLLSTPTYPRLYLPFFPATVPFVPHLRPPVRLSR
jgi:hypothetical protein